ncbi:MAG: helix-turn-helix domain-containing protein [Myroides sp.]|nr:helix-turn-helix domain-containing protein [Myroides sp.]
MKPNYHKIFSDIMAEEMLSVEKSIKCKKILSKAEISDLEVLNLNYLIFGESDDNKHKSYNDETITFIMSYQKEHHLTNQQISKLFHISRNTISSWKKLYLQTAKN